MLEDVLSMKKHDKKRWCSKKAREISTGRKRRGRVKAPVENKEILQKYMNNDKLKFKEIILNQSFLDDTCTLGDVDPTKNLKHFLSSLSTTTGITTIIIIIIVIIIIITRRRMITTIFIMELILIMMQKINKHNEVDRRIDYAKEKKGHKFKH